MIPEKPQTETWTDAQWQAIWQRDSEILVSAAAGSGKTAVLIRRLIEKITDSVHPIDVDELLVVTFTNAAAAEMRHRLSDALEAAIQLQPESTHLRKQLHLLNKAQISTLHSFCLQIIRQHGYLIDIDPGFRLASDNEAVMLQEDALEEIIEEAYETDQDRMYRLADSFSSDRSDRTLESLIVNLYSYARVHPHPALWLQAIADEYDVPQGITVDELSVSPQVKQAILYKIQTAIGQNSLYREIVSSAAGIEKLIETADVDGMLLKHLESIALSGSWQELYDAFGTVKWATAKSVRGEYDIDAKEHAAQIRNQYKKDISEIRDYYFARTPDRLLEEIRSMHPILVTLIDRVHEFSARYDEKKATRSLLDFSDLEHRAYEILTVSVGDKQLPSEVAKAYQRKFKEVLVDEYQDINLLQESIIQMVKKPQEETGNLFMVGDVKQSIYRFRLAEPFLFLSKYERFKQDAKQGVAIDLNANFRSRREVLSGINLVFDQIMGKDVGEIDYNEDASLKQGAPYTEEASPIEVHILSKDLNDEEQESPSNALAEARWTAEKIKSLVESGYPVTNPWTKETRPAEYRDMVVLMRSMTWTPEFLEIFKEYKIPLYVETKTGFYDALEIMWMMELLKVIDNPYQDIPVAAVLRSPLFGMTDEELALLRAGNRKVHLYDILLDRTLYIHLPDEAQSKIQHFLTLMKSWQKMSQTGPLADLIWHIYQDTFFLEIVAAMPAGAQRQSNLRMLINQAEQFEKSAYRGVFRFLRFIERMKKRGDDVGEAKSVTGRENVVRIMTIHASKGLEFPFVFLPGMARKFNMMDFNENYLFDQEFGLAVKAIDPDLRIAYQSLPFIAIKEKKQLQTKAEEMRILYVAMTRAREKLFMTLTVPSLDQAIEKWQTVGYVDGQSPVPPFIRSNALSYWDWLGPAWMRLKEFQEVTGANSAHLIPSQDVFDFHVQGTVQEIGSTLEQDTETDSFELNPSDQLLEQLKQTFDFVYPNELATKKTAKQTVTELKRLQQLETRVDDLFITPNQPSASDQWEEPVFIKASQQADSAAKGTAYHTVFQHLPLQGEVSPKELLESLVKREILTASEAALVRPEWIDAFLNSSLMTEIRDAKQIYRELPFTYSAQDEQGNRQIIQGVIDLFFEDTNGYWHLIDFKTDSLYRLKDQEQLIKQELKNRYKLQMSVYGQALEDILSIKLKTRRIYSVPFQLTVDI